MLQLWRIAHDNLDLDLIDILGQMDKAAGNVLSSIAVSRRIREVPKRRESPLLGLLNTYYYNTSTSQDIDRPQFSLARSSLTPTRLKNALITYKEILEQLKQCGSDTVDGKSVELLQEPQRTEASHENFSSDALSQANGREAAAKTLQDLLQLGQQLLSVLASPQQESPSEQDK